MGLWDGNASIDNSFLCLDRHFILETCIFVYMYVFSAPVNLTDRLVHILKSSGFLTSVIELVHKPVGDITICNGYKNHVIGRNI